MNARPGGATYDVIVAGGGPAGAAAALRLATTGLHVALIERSRYDRPRIGETLPPSVQPLLRDLQVWDRFRALDPLPSWGTRSLWGDPFPAELSHLASGYGSGWHVDRRRFDSMLAGAAADAGVEQLGGTSATICRFDRGQWSIASSSGVELRGRFLIDATGRRAGPARALGARRFVLDRLVAIAVQFGGREVSREQFLLVETATDGWWYTAPLPGGTLMAMLMTDADVCRSGRLSTWEAWRERLAATVATASRVGSSATGSVPVVHPAASHRLVRNTDRRPWLAVGDASLAVDPASGSGVTRALRSAAAAADAVAAMHAGGCARGGPILAYEDARDRESLQFLTERARFYGAEQRYDSAFWRRRQHGPVGRSVPSFF
ncbi:MAG TPA: tryptophan 7-halogenase [Nakamurella sp.]